MNIFIVGSGVMGKGITTFLCQSPLIESISWRASTPQRAEIALAEMHAGWDRSVRKQKATAEDVQLWKSKLNVVSGYEEVRKADLIIEAVSENVKAKETVFDAISKLDLGDAIVATNTSSLSITMFAQKFTKPENFIGLHFFNPATIMTLVEITAGMNTSEETISRAKQFVKSIGKEPVIVNEAPGFIVNRMLIPMINEAIAILSEGVATAEDIDKAMKLGANHPIGPLALADLIGNDVNLAIMETLHNETGDPKYRAHPLLRKMVRANRLGRKTGIGFFNYKKT